MERWVERKVEGNGGGNAGTKVIEAERGREAGKAVQFAVLWYPTQKAIKQKADTMQKAQMIKVTKRGSLRKKYIWG